MEQNFGGHLWLQMDSTECPPARITELLSFIYSVLEREISQEHSSEKSLYSSDIPQFIKF